MLIRDNSELNTLVSSSEGVDASRTEMIEISTVDEMMALKNISHLDLLKMDVQGWEMEVIRGASDLIANHNVMFIFAVATSSANATVARKKRVPAGASWAGLPSGYQIHWGAVVRSA